LGVAHQEVELAWPEAFSSSSCTFVDNSNTICHHKQVWRSKLLQDLRAMD